MHELEMQTPQQANRPEPEPTKNWAQCVHLCAHDIHKTAGGHFKASGIFEIR